jgi:hemerythrin superfamily protein
MDGPSTAPQPLYETRVRGGRVEIRRVPEPGDEAVRPEEVARERRRPVPPPPPGARDARVVLREHHDLMRALFRQVEAMDRDDPERRDVMRTLAGELEIHERVEDEIFYPAVRPVSEDVPAAHAEHQQLSDMLAVTLRLGTHSPEFEEKVRALHQGVDHHASAEEASMFAEAERLGEDRLRHMGAEIEAMLDELRASRASSAFRDLKIRLLEGA